MNGSMDKKKVVKMIAEALLYSSINVSLGSVEMSSKFSVRSFAKDQETLQSACNALADYLIISAVWTIGVAMLLYVKYGFWGIVTGIVSNLLIMFWIYWSYNQAFKTAVNKYSLEMPKLNFFHWNLAQ